LEMALLLAEPIVDNRAVTSWRTCICSSGSIPDEVISKFT
jgi:hypothetical protein